MTAFLLIVGTYALWDTALTLVHLPYYSLGVESHPEYDERTTVVSFGAIGALAGFVLGGVLLPVLAADGSPAGYRIAGALFGALAGLTVGIATMLLPPAPITASNHVGLRESFRSLAGSAGFVRLLIVEGLVRFGLTMASATLVYFVTAWLGEDDAGTAKYVVALLLGAGVSLPGWRWLSTRWDKVPAYTVGLVVSAVALGAVWLIPPGGSTVALVAVAGVGVANGAQWIIPWSILADLADRTDIGIGTHFGVYGVVEKGARSLALVTSAAMLALADYVPGSTGSTDSTTVIRVLAGPAPAIVMAAAAAAAWSLPVSRPHVRAASP
jgi:GPH family glycoside/pentoside/hexuronide:cation symporter